MSTDRLPGMPGPTKHQLETRENIRGALIQLHHSLLPLLGELPTADSAKSSLQFTYMVEGDKLIVTVVPGGASE